MHCNLRRVASCGVVFSLALLVACAVTPRAQAAGLTITATFDDASATAAGYSVTDFHNAFNFAAQEFQNLFSDNVHVNLNVRFGNTGLGASSTPLIGFFNYATIRSQLAADNTLHPSADGTTSINNLPLTIPAAFTNDSFLLARSQAKALGFLADDLVNDGTITFSNVQPYTFDPNNRQIAGKFDFIGVAEHEISETMGRIQGLGATFGTGAARYLDNDLFRFTPNGTRSVNNTDQNVNFSIDGGATVLTRFNPPGGGDLSDYFGTNPTDPFNASTGTNQGHALNSVDITNMDVIGWDLITRQGPSVPEPATMTMLGIAVVGFAGYGWRRRKAAVA